MSPVRVSGVVCPGSESDLRRLFAASVVGCVFRHNVAKSPFTVNSDKVNNTST